MESRSGGAKANTVDLPGRSEELARLGELITTGRAQPVVVRGPAGIGKTALIEAVLSAMPVGHATVLRARCRDATGGYAAVRSLFSPGDSSRQVPRSAAGQEAYAAMHELHRLADEEIRRAGRAVIVLDDLQFCDPQSLRWIDFQLRRSAGLPLAIVLAYRTGTPPAGGPAGIDCLGWNTVMDLGPLSDAAVTNLAARAYGQAIEPSFARACAEASGGNPGLLTRMLGELRRHGVAPVDSEVTRVVDAGRTAVITSAFADDVDVETDPVRAVAVVSAVLGEADPALASALTGLPAGVVRAAVGTLAHMGLLAEDGCRIRDEIVTAAVLDGLTEQQLADLRARVARLLSDAGRPAQRVADQLLELPALTEPWMLDTLRDVSREIAGAHRARYLRPLLAADPTDIPTRLDLARVLGRTDPATASRLLWETLDMTTDPRERAVIASRVALTAPGTTKTAELLDEVLDDLADGDGDLVAAAEAARMITGIYGRATIAATLSRRMPAAPAGDTSTERLLLAALGLASAARGEPAHVAVGYARRALQADEVRFGGLTLFLSAFVLSLAGETTDALEALDRMLAASRARVDVRAECAALSLRSMVLCQSGEIAKATTDAESAVEITRRTPAMGDAALPRIALAAALARGHDPARAAALLDKIDPESLGALEYHEYLMARSTVHWALGDPRQALENLLTCGHSLAVSGIDNPVFATWWVDAACVLAELGRSTEAQAVAGYGRVLSRRWNTSHSHGFALLAEASAAAGPEAVSLLSDAVSKLAGQAFRLHHLRAEYWLGVALLQTGDVKAARSRFRRVVDLAMGCGHRILATKAREQLVVSGGRMQSITGALADMLTVSERRVATLAAGGLNNREIAESLVVTLRTVEIHLTNAYRKLGVTGRENLPPVLFPPAEGGSACG
jgi:DNA-binding CsgD family transcriptional regulator